MEASKRWPVWPEAVGRPLDPTVQSFKDILDGLAVLYDDPFIRDVRNTVLGFPESRIGIALNKKQTACKKWAVEELGRACGPELGTVHILAGWYGLLAAMLLNAPGLRISHLTVIDVDPACEPVALSLNATPAHAGRFAFRCHDILTLDYAAPPSGLRRPDLIINTSCEHLDRFEAWFARIPDGMLVLLQSNDYSEIPEHVSCVESLTAFEAKAPLSERLFAGQLELGKYTRFMLIGRK